VTAIDPRVEKIREALGLVETLCLEHAPSVIPWLITDGSPEEALASLEKRNRKLTEALREIASVDCQIACDSLEGASRCVTCVARDALAEREEGQ